MQTALSQQNRLVALIALCLLLATSDARAQKLGAIKAAAAGTDRSPGSDSGSDSRPSDSPSRPDDDDHHDDHHPHDWNGHDDVVVTGFSDLSGQLLLAALSAPFVVPRAIVDDTDLQPIEFPDFPYPDSRRLLGDGDPLPWQLILRGQYGDDFHSVSHASGRVLWDTTWRVGIDTEFFYRNERLSAGRHDELWTGDVNLVYTFAKGELGQFRTGVGVNWLTARGQSDAGFNFTYGGELYPADPFVITGDIDWGRIGDASLFHGRATVGITRDGWGLFTGYDYFSIGDVDLHAWINGFELRF